MTVKDNHSLLRKNIERFFASPTLFEPILHTARSHCKGHGRIEGAESFSGNVPKGYLDWPHVGQVFRLTRTRICGGCEQHETVYGLTSLSPQQTSPTRQLSLVRGYWHIEDKSH